MDIYKFYGFKQLDPFLAIILEQAMQPERFLGERSKQIHVPKDLVDYDYFEIIINAVSKEIVEVRPLELTSSEMYNEAIRAAIVDNDKMFSDLKELEIKNKKPRVNYETIQGLMDRYYLYADEFENELEASLKPIFQKFPVHVEMVEAEKDDINKAYRKISIPKK